MTQLFNFIDHATPLELIGLCAIIHLGIILGYKLFKLIHGSSKGRTHGFGP